MNFLYLLLLVLILEKGEGVFSWFFLFLLLYLTLNDSSRIDAVMSCRTESWDSSIAIATEAAVERLERNEIKADENIIVGFLGDF